MGVGSIRLQIEEWLINDGDGLPIRVLDGSDFLQLETGIIVGDISSNGEAQIAIQNSDIDKFQCRWGRGLPVSKDGASESAGK